MFGSDKKYLSFSLNETVIKLVQGRSSGIIEKVASVTAVDTSAESLVQALKKALSGFDRKAPVICVIPAGAATSKTIEIPSSDPAEIKSIINLQVSRHTPYSKEEVLVGYINLGTVALNNTKVLLVIVHRNVVKDRLAILEKAQLNPDKILFAAEGVGRLYTKGLNLKKDSAPVGVIDIALTGVNFTVVARGATLFSRNIPIGIKSIIEEGPQAVSLLAEEINVSVAAYNSEDAEAPVSSFVVSTDHDVVKNMLPALKEGLKAEVVASPFINFVKAGSVKNKLQKDYADDSFLDAIAPLVTVSKSEINLMPDEMLVKKDVEKQSKEAIKTVFAALLILVLLGLILMSNIYYKEKYLNDNLKAKFSAQKQEVEKLQGQMSKVKLVKGYLQGRMVSLDIVHELYKLTPNQIYLNSILLDEDGSVTITGVAASSSGNSESWKQIHTYEKSLSGSSLFRDFKEKSTTPKKDNGKDVIGFEFNLKVED